MNGADQFYIFLTCVCFGIFSGVFYDVIYCAVLPFKKPWVRIVGEIIFSILFTVLYLFASVLFGFPAFRIYMFLGCAAGFYLYLKSFHKIVAFFSQKVYNKIRSTREERKICHERDNTPKRKRRPIRKQKESQ